MNLRVCHLSSAHHGLDVRIFAKECVSLAKAGCEVHLVLSANPGDVGKAAAEGVVLHPVPSVGGRPSRFVLKAWRTFRVAWRTRAQVYHFHDPELLPWGVLLRLRGAAVVYDAHEDFPLDLLGKDWIPAMVRRPLAWFAERFEKLLSRAFFQVVAATPTIRDKFRARGVPAVAIGNFPRLADLAPRAPGREERRVCYIGALSPIRGVVEIVEAIGRCRTGTRLALAGAYEGVRPEDLATRPGWQRVDDLGWLSRDQVGQLLAGSIAGLVTLHPEPNYVVAQPIKMFEYMGAGLPVIASDFPAWREVIDAGGGCGLRVDPLDPDAIAAAIDWLAEHPEDARRMGANGRQAVERMYNWEAEEKALLDFYAALPTRPPS